MAEWPTEPLGGMATRDGFAIGPFGSRMKSSNYTSEGARVVRGLNITPSGKIEGKFVFVSNQFADSLGSARLRSGDITLPHRGAIGRAALVTDDDLVMSTSLMRVRVDKEVADPRFVAAFLASEAGQREILQFASTVGTPGIGQPLTSLKQVRVPLPSLDEQRRIADVLGALDDLIEMNRQFAQHVRELSSLLYANFAAAAPGEVAVGQVATVSAKKVRPGSGLLRYIDIAAMGDGFLELPAPIDWSDAPSRARVGVEDGSTLWSTVRPNRRAHALVVDAPDDLVASTGIAVLTPKSIGPAELFAASDCDEFVDQLVAVADGSAYPAVRPVAFANVTVSSLGDTASGEFERVMWPLWRVVHAALEDNARLMRTRDELLPLLMSGRVRVREVA